MREIGVFRQLDTSRSSLYGRSPRLRTEHNDVTWITSWFPSPCNSLQMQRAPLLSAIGKLALLGEQAGISVAKMIQILEAGFSVKDLLRLIESRISRECSASPAPNHWIM